MGQAALRAALRRGEQRTAPRNGATKVVKASPGAGASSRPRMAARGVALRYGSRGRAARAWEPSISARTLRGRTETTEGGVGWGRETRPLRRFGGGHAR